MLFSPWREGFLSDSCTRMAGARSHASFLYIKFFIFLTIALEHPCCGPLHVPPEHVGSCKDGCSAESWQRGKVH